MKKLFAAMFIAMILLSPIISNADQGLNNSDFSATFENYGAVMLLIDPTDGSIIYANQAARSFYGYDQKTLLSMKITDINISSSEEINAEMNLAHQEKRNFFEFRHKLSDGSIRSVEVYSYPVKINNRDLLFSIIHDATDEIEFQKNQEELQKVIFITGFFVVLILIILVIFLVISGRKLKISKNLLDNMNALRETFINADNRLIYLKDENLNYVFVNHSFEKFYQKTSNEIIGKNDFDLTDDGFSKQRRWTDMEVKETGKLIVDEEMWNEHTYEVTKFPIKMPNGKYGVGAYKRDVTEERLRENKQNRILLRHMILVDIMSREFAGKEEHMDYVLHKALELTESRYGYIYFYNETTKEFQLNTWSNGVMEDCEIVEKMTKYQWENTGFWGEAVRQRKPIIENHFERENPLKKGYPAGHVSINKFMSVPIIIDDKIEVVIGLANKNADYDDDDVYEITILMKGIWNEMIRKEAQKQLSVERKRYLQTLVSIGDGVLAVDGSGTVEMLNSIAEKLTGWSDSEAKGRPYKEIFKITHEIEGMKIADPIEEVFKTDAVCELGNHAILTSRDGIRYHLEDSAAPIKDDNGKTLGVVLVFRDVSEKKEQRERIEYLSFHDSLTGLHNRRFFEEELYRIDVERNLPISVIMIDANGLKITNDIFGHTYGDMLLRKIAEVLKRVCRADDITARWGGDEFVVLLPNTEESKAIQIADRIQKELLQEEVRAIKASVSIGHDTKVETGINIIEVLNRAESKMYRNKTLGRDEFQRETIESIIQKLHDIDPMEKRHSQNVSDLSASIGERLKLSESDLRNLRTGGYLHDIGKIIFDEADLTETGNLAYGEREKHVLIGYRILNSFNSQDIADIILSHHEQWDGKGYPRGLKGEEIPLLARIVAASDYYFKLKDASKVQDEDISTELVNHLRAVSGSRLDPFIVNILIESYNSDLKQ